MAKPNKRNEREWERILKWAADQIGDDDGFKRWGGQNGLIVLRKHCKVEFEAGVPFSGTKDDLLGALIALQRADRHTGGGTPEEEEVRFARALFESAAS